MSAVKVREVYFAVDQGDTAVSIRAEERGFNRSRYAQIEFKGEKGDKEVLFSLFGPSPSENAMLPERPAHLFKPGVAANPKGRPKGTRNKVATAFFDDLHAIWTEQGDAVLRRAAFEKPMEFAAMVAKLMPAKLEISTPTHGLTDERFQELMDLAERQLAVSASMTIEGSVVELEGGGGSPRAGDARGEVIDLIPSSAPPTEPILDDTPPIFAAALQATPVSLPAETLVEAARDAGPADGPEPEIDIASLF